MTELCTGLPNAAVHAGFCASELPLTVFKPRSVLSVGTSDLLVLERGSASVLYAFDTDGDGIPDAKRILATAPNLNHGLALHNGHIYASSDTTVYRWTYEGSNFDSIGEQEVIVNNINADGKGGAPKGHTTRTLAFDDAGMLYISVGSYLNVDADSYRSRIRRFDIFDNDLEFPLDFQTGEVFADGLRNEVGLAFDAFGVLWGVENGADQLSRSDMEGNINEDNPAEELNRFLEEDRGKHWGYPYCWTEYSLPEEVSAGRGAAWAWPTFLESGAISDQECRTQYVPSVISMQAHSAPLGIVFYDYSEEKPLECEPGAGFPREYDGYAFIAFHGSWNRIVPTGYKVVYIPFDENGDAIGQPVDLLAHEGPNARWEDGFRPVDVDFDDCGRLVVTSDGTWNRGSKIVRIEALQTPVSSSIPTQQPSSNIFSTAKPSICNPNVAYGYVWCDFVILPFLLTVFGFFSV